MRRWLKGLLAGLFIALVGIGLAMSPLGAGLEQRVGLSWLFDRRGPVEPPAEVAVVAMDSRTGKQLGLPVLPRDWPRSIHAQLVDALVARGAALIVFDVHFGREKDNADDQLFVDAVERGASPLVSLVRNGRKSYDSALLVRKDAGIKSLDDLMGNEHDTDVLPKPFPMRELKSAVERMLRAA